MKCKYETYAMAGYIKGVNGKRYLVVMSPYEVYCFGCKNFVNLCY